MAPQSAPEIPEWEKDGALSVPAATPVRLLREGGRACRVLRLSLLPLGNEERSVLQPQRYLCAVPAAAVAAALRRCDLLLFCSEQEEGFGLECSSGRALEAQGGAVELGQFAHVALDNDRLGRVRPEELAGKFGMALGKTRNDIRVKSDADNHRLLADALQCMGMVGPDEQKVALGQSDFSIRQPLPDLAVLDPE